MSNIEVIYRLNIDKPLKKHDLKNMTGQTYASLPGEGGSTVSFSWVNSSTPDLEEFQNSVFSSKISVRQYKTS